MIKVLVFLLLLTITLPLIFYLAINRSASRKIISPVAAGSEASSQSAQPPAAGNSLKIVADWSRLAAASGGDVGVALIDLTDNQSLRFNDRKVFPAASLSKLLVAAYLLSQADKGKINLRELVGDNTLQDHARLMVNESNNDSWEILDGKLGYSNIENFGRGLGMPTFDNINNQTAAYGLGIFLQKLYNGQVTSEGSKQLLLSWMRGTDTEDRIPSVIPSGVTVYHKAGTFDGTVHDMAIVLHPKRPFVLVVLTDGAKDGSDTIRQVALSAWEYIDSK